MWINMALNAAVQHYLNDSNFYYYMVLHEQLMNDGPLNGIANARIMMNNIYKLMKTGDTIKLFIQNFNPLNSHIAVLNNIKFITCKLYIIDKNNPDYIFKRKISNNGFIMLWPVIEQIIKSCNVIKIVMTQKIKDITEKKKFYIIKNKKYLDFLINEGNKECPILLQELKVTTVGQIYKPKKNQTEIQPLEIDQEQEKNSSLEINTAQLSPLQPLAVTDHVEVVRSASLLNLSSVLLQEKEIKEISQQSIPVHFFNETANILEKTPVEKAQSNLNKSFLRVPLFHTPCRQNFSNETECVQEISPLNSPVATAALEANLNNTPQAGPSKSKSTDESPSNSPVAVAAAALEATGNNTPQAGPSKSKSTDESPSNSPVAVAAAALEATGNNTPQAGPSKSKSTDIKCPECHKIYTCCHDNNKRTKSKKKKNKSTFPCPKCEKEYTLVQNLKRHIKSAHTTFKIEWCIIPY
ncbi:hypothetical protein PUN28_012757 [Cardiocondyla obscurior]|uniref:C2H2-type domain-containing protein n=1 Tax=Cardiocondyla obscurior TaxID=286306 RepID=A0AAW2F827_9HYME